MRASLVRGNLVEEGQLMVTGVFGGMERTTGECFLVEVEHRDAATLLPIIQQHVRPGNIVYSDEWSSCHRINSSTGLVHKTVNHTLHFVDPASGAHTQGIEGMCGAAVKE